ncbi:hypothetical protein, variant [Salpingoeca rosetta]|uniref:ATP-grasp domain-containing protein n=1 Tax=Salpingoeca rosetta (strain ATCC 50818 / BSB-021) TaxID=946362 RepID=F2U7I8_SALR5|nr:hypothetical protein, variant [Salpingoeca rosetta]EGD83405.1 hypothetical protein, variant [Salpingoeca rosetta]|eukprot:XP_004994909.1 hypothetical protein, variant [Salpingoeca rosetta]
MEEQQVTAIGGTVWCLDTTGVDIVPTQHHQQQQHHHQHHQRAQRGQQPRNELHHQQQLTAMALCIAQPEDDVLMHSKTAASLSPFSQFCATVLNRQREQVICFTETEKEQRGRRQQGALDVLPDTVLRALSDSNKRVVAHADLFPHLQQHDVTASPSALQRATPTTALNRLIYRDANTPDVPPVLQDSGLKVKTPHGLSTTSAEDVLALYNRVQAENTDSDVLIELIVRDVAGMATSTLVPRPDALSTTLEQQTMAPRRVVDTWTVRAMPKHTFVDSTTIFIPFAHQELLSAYQLHISSERGCSLRFCPPPPALSSAVNELLTVSKRLMQESPICEYAFGGFTFVLNSTSTYLIDVTLGLSHAIAAVLFNRRHGNASHIGVWPCPVARFPDIWTFWATLHDRDCAYHPSDSASSSGLFPLHFTSEGDGSCTLVALSSAPERLEELWSVSHGVSALCIPRAHIKDAPSAGLHPSLRRIWVGSARPEYRLETQRYRLPNRCLALMRAGTDVIVLPGNHAPTREYWEFVRDVKGLSEEQAIFTSNEHFVLDNDMLGAPLAQLAHIVEANPDDTFCLLPYCVTPGFEEWAGHLLRNHSNVVVCGDASAWVDVYGHKGILHRHVARPHEASVIERATPHVRVARGFTCDTVDDLLLAYDLLGDDKAVIKPVFGAAGEGIVFVSSAAELTAYTFPMGQVSLEEFLPLDKADDDMEIAPAIHYMAKEVIGTCLVDQLMQSTAYCGWRASVTAPAFQQICMDATQAILGATSPTGPGGFDFLSVGGNPVLTDVNTGRFNGAHFPKLFLEANSPGRRFYSFKFKPGQDLCIRDVWTAFEAQGIQFVPGESDVGVFPIVYLRGLAALFIAIAETDEEAHALHLRAVACLTQLQDASGAPA